MQEYHQRARVRKYPVRLKFIRVSGFKRRRRWLRPFVVSIYRLERLELGAGQ
jgi:hypothetical protein